MKKAKSQAVKSTTKKDEVRGRIGETRKGGGLEPLGAQKGSNPRRTTVPRDDTTPS
ncbi:MAG TPA: hypothetical protein VF751_07120 [Chthoniobacterales bacterium]